MTFWCCFVIVSIVARGEGRICTPVESSVRWVGYYAASYKVPVELVEAIIDEESAWDPCAVSSRGATGIMQLMPATAIRFGVHNQFHARENIRGGIAYLSWLLQRFGGDLRLVTASYYVGERAIAAKGLRYSSRDVHSYVEHVAERYRVRRMLRTYYFRSKES